jgi:hypothetical protein
VTGSLAYAGTLGVMAGFGEADAGTREIPSSDCHAEFDDNGANLKNSGALTWLGTGTKNINCPISGDSITPIANTTSVTVYGNEVTNNALSRTCMCTVNPIDCNCSSFINWSNNTGGVSGVVALNLSANIWGSAPTQKFAYPPCADAEFRARGDEGCRAVSAR